MPDDPNLSLACPLPIEQYPHVLLAHGGGGRLMHQLIGDVFLAAFSNPILDTHHDSAVLDRPPGRIAFTTDSYVVRPLFFPGGDLGAMAVYGTVNDLAMSGARPLYLSAAFILEEGLPMETLWRVVRSMQEAARVAGVQIVTGDTKVVDKGSGDGLFINTAGIGIIEHNLVIGPQRVGPDDVVLVNGDLGRHGMAVMALREGLAFQSAIESDSRPLAGLVLELLNRGIDIHCMRDPTRGGLASSLNEIAQTARVEILVDGQSVPVREDVRAACELLGLDPLQVACEGRFIALVSSSDADRALSIMRSNPAGAGACRIGRVLGRGGAKVVLESAIGPRRLLDMASGEQLPRIC
jgi:hydrogenase expression/formation protein HypE